MGFTDFWLEMNHRFREQVGKRLKLRPGLPLELTNQGELAFYRLVLERSRISPKARTVVDVGCRNWSYAPTLAEYFPDAELHGVEVDGARRYLTLHRRMDAALAQAVALFEVGRCAHTHFKDFRETQIRGPDMAFTFFFPFVSQDPCRAWGLPANKFASFAELLEHALYLCDGKCQILSAHQGEWEAELARDAYTEAGLKVRERVLYPEEFSGLWPSPHPVQILAHFN